MPVVNPDGYAVTRKYNSKINDILKLFLNSILITWEDFSVRIVLSKSLQLGAKELI
jgi:hypothetical protein